MSYSVTTYLVSLDKLHSICGSGDTKLAQEIIAAHQESLEGTDAMGEYFEVFQDDYEEEYEAYKKGDFSHKHEIWDEPEDDGEGELTEEQQNELIDALKSGDNKKVFDFIENAMEGMFDDEDEEFGDEEDEDDEPLRELTAGGAVADLILGRPKDPNFGYKYGYGLETMCRHLGKHVEGDAWYGINYRALDLIAAVGPKDGGETLWIDVLLQRGAPVEMPLPFDFPTIGYASWQELEKGKPAFEAAYSAAEDNPDADWEVEALDDFLKWVDQAISQKTDLVFFYY